jgi:hypothetical protein
VAAELEELTYDLALRALRSQEETLNEVRSRTGTLLAASSLTASFLGGLAIDRSGFGALAILGLVAFGLSVLASLSVLLPKEGLVFVLDGPEVYSELFPFANDPLDVHRRLPYWLQTFRASNQRTVDGLLLRFRLATIALVFEIALWALQLAIA